MGIAKVPQFIGDEAINGFSDIGELLKGIARTKLMTQSNLQLAKKVGYQNTGKTMSNELANNVQELEQYGRDVVKEGNIATVKAIPDMMKGSAVVSRKMTEEGIDNMTTGKAINTLMRNDDGSLSKLKVGGAVASAYMGANLIGHGSLGIPFISTASWNR